MSEPFCCHTFRRPIVEPTTVQTPPIHQPLCSFLGRNHIPGCTEIYRRRSSISRNSSRRGRFRSLHRWKRPGGSETHPPSCILHSLHRSLFAVLIFSFLADRHKRRKFLGHITISKQIFHLLRLPHPKCIPQSWRIPIKVSSNHLKLSIVLRELMVSLLNLQHFCFGSGYSVWVHKSCFQQLYKSWYVFQSYCSVLLDMWQDLV